jgi:hypothetical protein
MLERMHGIRLPRTDKGNEGGIARRLAREKAETLGEPVKPPDREESAAIAALHRKVDEKERELARHRDHIAIVSALCRESIQTLRPVKSFRPRRESKGPEHDQVAMLDLSDWHFGEFVSPEMTGGLGGYSWEIALERIQQLSEKVHTFVREERQNRPTGTLYINLLGDMTTGEVVFASQWSQIDRNRLDQFFEGGAVLARFIQTMAALFEEVHVRAVPGNHPENKKQREQHHILTRQEMEFLGNVAQALREQPNVTFNISYPGWCCYELWGKRHLLLHGDTVAGWMGVPWYGVNRMLGQLASILRFAPEYVHLAHFHVEAKVPWGYSRVYFNGSMVGPTPYSVGKNLASDPCQVLHFVHEEQGITKSPPIYLARPPKLVPDESGIMTPIWKLPWQKRDSA